MEKDLKVKAYWNEWCGEYQISDYDLFWYSSDGNNWFDKKGNPIKWLKLEEFKSTSIVLVGGPRAYEII